MSAQNPQVEIIAEAGVNHNGSLELACQLVEAAAKAGADTIKFQTFKAAALVTRTARKAAYQARETRDEGSQFDMLARLELSDHAHRELTALCAARGIRFLSSAFDHDSLAFLINELNLPVIKFGSGELGNAPLLYQAARSGRRIILSSGMAPLGDIERALGVLALGYSAQGDSRPRRHDFDLAWANPVQRRLLPERVVLLHCTSQYPTPHDEVNLRAMDTLRAAFAIPVGYSDHTLGTTISEAAVARGAVIIEKHLTLDCHMDGPDHSASLEPSAFARMVTNIRAVEAALGDGIKVPSRCELDTAAVAKRSLVALRPIAIGDAFTRANLGVKRPGTGISPTAYWEYLERHAKRAYDADELLDE